MRVERLKDITEEDAQAEGAALISGDTGRLDGGGNSIEFGSYVAGFCEQWEADNGKGSWEANPWVWVIEFKHVK